MLTCGCGRWMHTEGIEERTYDDGALQWFIRSECRGCGLKVGVDVPAGQPGGLVDRMMWTDDALHRLDRMPPYLAPLFRDEVEQDLRTWESVKDYLDRRRLSRYEEEMIGEVGGQADVEHVDQAVDGAGRAGPAEDHDVVRAAAVGTSDPAMSAAWLRLSTAAAAVTPPESTTARKARTSATSRSLRISIHY